MRTTKLRRLLVSRCQMEFNRDAGVRGIISDAAQEFLGFPPGAAMFDDMEIGQIVVLDTFSFPLVGEVLRFNDQGVTLKNAVRVLYDGRHGQFASGAENVPSNAEVEATYPVYTVSSDFIGGWGIYPGKKIPKPQ